MLPDTVLLKMVQGLVVTKVYTQKGLAILLVPEAIKVVENGRKGIRLLVIVGPLDWKLSNRILQTVQVFILRVGIDKEVVVNVVPQGLK